MKIKYFLLLKISTLFFLGCNDTKASRPCNCFNDSLKEELSQALVEFYKNDFTKLLSLLDLEKQNEYDFVFV